MSSSTTGECHDRDADLPPGRGPHRAAHRTPGPGMKLPGAAPIDRADSADLAFLAMDWAGVPEQFGAVMVLDRSMEPAAVGRILADRLEGMPRMRRRLARTPPGCGRSVWVDDETFDIGRHVGTVTAGPPADRAALMELATGIVTEPLPRDRPLWRGAVIPRLGDGGGALVMVMHHVLADGLGGLAVLAGLFDGPSAAAAGP